MGTPIIRYENAVAFIEERADVGSGPLSVEPDGQVVHTRAAGHIHAVEHAADHEAVNEQAGTGLAAHRVVGGDPHVQMPQIPPDLAAGKDGAPAPFHKAHVDIFQIFGGEQPGESLSPRTRVREQDFAAVDEGDVIGKRVAARQSNSAIRVEGDIPGGGVVGEPESVRDVAVRGQSGRGRGAPQIGEVDSRGHREVFVAMVSRVGRRRIQRLLRFLLIVIAGVVPLLAVGGPVVEIARSGQRVHLRISAAGIQHIVEAFFQQIRGQRLIVVILRSDCPIVLVRHR